MFLNIAILLNIFERFFKSLIEVSQPKNIYIQKKKLSAQLETCKGENSFKLNLM